MRSYPWLIVALLLLLNLVNNMDRLVYAVAGPVLQHSLGLSEISFARMVEVFQFTFAIGCLAYGPLIDRFGVRTVMTLAVIWFSVAQWLHAIAWSAISLGVVRFGLAAGEAPIYPATLKAISEWAPASERGAMAGAVHFGVMAGPVIVPLFLPLAMSHWGWQAGFMVTGALGLIAVFPFWVLYSSPESSTRASPEEVDRILRTRVTVEGARSSGWLSLLRHRQVWVYIVIQAVVNPAWWFILYWLPKFLGEVFGIRGPAITPYLVAVYGVAAIGAAAGGPLSGLLLNWGYTRNVARKFVMFLCGVLMPFVLLATHTRSAWLAVAVIGLAAVLHQIWTTTGVAILADLIPARTLGSVAGMGTFFGSMAGVVGAEVIGRILFRNPGHYQPIFIYVAGAYLAAAVLIHILSPRLESAPEL